MLPTFWNKANVFKLLISRTNIKETAKGFLLIVLSDTHESLLSYQIVIDSNYVKIFDFVQINEKSFNTLFFN